MKLYLLHQSYCYCQQLTPTFNQCVESGTSTLHSVAPCHITQQFSFHNTTDSVYGYTVYITSPRIIFFRFYGFFFQILFFFWGGNCNEIYSNFRSIIKFSNKITSTSPLNWVKRISIPTHSPESTRLKILLPEWFCSQVFYWKTFARMLLYPKNIINVLETSGKRVFR